jgi:hypothetical protein
VCELGQPRLVASLGDVAPSEGAGVVRRALESLQRDAGGDDDGFEARCAVARALASVDAWLARRAGVSIAGLVAPRTARSRRRVLDRIAAVGARAPRHRRAPLSPLLAEARRAASAPLGVGAERVLEALAASELDDEAWLRAVATFGRLHSPGGTLARPAPERPRVLALLVLR